MRPWTSWLAADDAMDDGPPQWALYLPKVLSYVPTTTERKEEKRMGSFLSWLEMQSPLRAFRHPPLVCCR